MGLSDVSAGLLSMNKPEIEKYSKVLVPDYDRFQLASDKYQTMKFCMENNIPCPVTLDADSQGFEEHLSELKFPVVVKPKTGVGAVGFFIIENREALDEKLPGLKSEYGSMLIQEYIPNKNQYTVEVFLDQKSEVKASVVANKRRFFPINGGTSSCIVTEQNPEIAGTVKRLLEKIGWLGSANVDLILDPRDGIAKVIEINPRVGATVKIAHLSGVDIAQMTLNHFNDKYIEPTDEYQSGIVMRNMMLDLMWLLFAPPKQKFNSDPSFFRLLGRGVHYQNFSVQDPFPFVGYFLGNLLGYADMERLKRKLGKTNL
jgi:predicted ATP-grasp superfamily ATP-dependent carboligase